MESNEIVNEILTPDLKAKLHKQTPIKIVNPPQVSYTIDPLSFVATIHKETPKAYMFKVPLNTDQYITKLKPNTSIFIWMPKTMVKHIELNKWRALDLRLLNTNLNSGFNYLKQSYPNINPNAPIILR